MTSWGQRHFRQPYRWCNFNDRLLIFVLNALWFRWHIKTSVLKFGTRKQFDALIHRRQGSELDFLVQFYSMNKAPAQPTAPKLVVVHVASHTNPKKYQIILN